MTKAFHFTKRDAYFLVSLCLLGIALTLWIFWPASAEHSILEVRLDGQVYMRLSLEQNTDKTIYGTHDTINHFQIQDGIVKMIDANCNDHTCINTQGIHRPGQTIVCLPHRLVLAIVDDDNEGVQPDAIVQ